MRAYRISVPAQDEDTAVALLWEAGTVGIEVQTAEGESRAVLIAYFEKEPPGSLLGHALPDATIETTPVPDLDWVARFRESFRSFRAGSFVIAPPWDLPREAPRGTTLVVDPGRAFGTGTHETTRLCLAALEERARRGPLGRVLDLGCGTGILGIAAARLGARSVTASDVDPEATVAARTHATLNRVRLGVVRADGTAAFSHGVFDLVLANLTAPLLVAQATGLQALLAPRGGLVLSGLLESDLRDVQEAFDRVGSPRVRRDGEWAALLYEVSR